jgi:intein/homing endonuclease
MTPEEERKILDALARAIEKDAAASMAELMALLADGMGAAKAVKTVAAAFGDVFAARMAGALNIPVKAVIDMPLTGSNVKLSKRLHDNAAETARTVDALMRQHQAAMMDARKLALQIYEGYGFNEKELLLTPRNRALPVALRNALHDPTWSRDLKALLARAPSLKTPALKAAYMQALDALEKGAGQDRIDRMLDTAYQEKMRYFANRIAVTELHREYENQRADEYAAWDDLEYVQIRLSSKHPVTDICDLYAKQNKYGKGAGVYPKALAPRPPFHPHCLLGDALVTSAGRVTAVSKRWFYGDIVIIATASGKRLSATVNHPVLTPRGWVGAGLLDVGDKVIARVDFKAVGGDPVINDQHQDMPASIAEITDAFLRSGEVATREVPVSTEDFHGDGVASKVAIIGADSKLWDRIDAAASHVATDHFLDPAHAARAGLFGAGVLDLAGKAFRLAPDRVMGGSGNGSSIFRRGLRHTDSRSGFPASNINSVFDQDGFNARPLNAVFSCDSKAGHAGYIVGNNSGDHVVTDNPAFLASDCTRLGGASGSETGFHDSRFYSGLTDSELSAYILKGFTGEVFSDEVIRVDFSHFHGHVYNLETERHDYTANGIITHNCRCVASPRIDLSGQAVFKPGADRVYLRGLPASDAAKVAGSRTALQRLLNGDDAALQGAYAKDAARERWRRAVAKTDEGATVVVVNDAFEIAKKGGRHGGTYEQFKEEKPSRIEKSIRNMEKRIKEHQGKIKNPMPYVDGDIDSRHLNDLVTRYWPREIEDFKAKIFILRGILRDRKNE